MKQVCRCKSSGRKSSDHPVKKLNQVKVSPPLRSDDDERKQSVICSVFLSISAATHEIPTFTRCCWWYSISQAPPFSQHPPVGSPGGDVIIAAPCCHKSVFTLDEWQGQNHCSLPHSAVYIEIWERQNETVSRVLASDTSSLVPEKAHQCFSNAVLFQTWHSSSSQRFCSGLRSGLLLGKPFL